MSNLWHWITFGQNAAALGVILQLRYRSQDGRFFLTVAMANGLDLTQSTSEVDANGGALSSDHIGSST